MTTIDISNLTGTTFQGWKLVRELGNGADGVVYEGENGIKTAAVKIYLPDAIAKSGFEEAKQRLDLQLKLKGCKRHPNLVEVLDGGVQADTKLLYLVMELVPGETLDKVITKLPRSHIPKLIKQLADAAEHLHVKEGLVHRDIKPSNIMVSSDFELLTLLDLGIALSHDAENRVSGEEFVASLRYSPHEFVWRTEDATDESAWLAVTFYQIGATLHDLIMQRPIFSGFDKPRAALYDSVRLRPPQIESKDCPEWLIELTKCCLVKDWRERLNHVKWADFSGPSDTENALDPQRQRIRIRQIRAEEARMMRDEAEKKKQPTNSREVELWNLHNKLFMETRRYLLSAQIFPKFSATDRATSEREYVHEYDIERDERFMFDQQVKVRICLSADSQYERATDIAIKVSKADGTVLLEGTWTESFTVETAAALVQRVMQQAAELIVPNT